LVSHTSVLCVQIELTQHAARTRPKRKRKQIEEEDEESNNAYDSDDLDNESVVEVLKARHTRTRQTKKRNKINKLELEEGQELVGVVVEPPKTGLVPPGQISKNTFNFLGKLTKLECNNRAW